MKPLLATTFAALTLGSATAAQAGDLYLGAGLPGLTLGYAHPVDDRFTLRADVSTLGRLDWDRSKSGVDYDGRVQVDRLAFFGDWHVHRNVRLTAGLTVHEAKARLTGRADGTTITIGDRTYVAGPDDQLNVRVKYPTVMPYLGIGFGKPPQAVGGWGVMVDLGLAFGKPKVTGQVSGPLLSNTVSQADVDRELDDIRDDVERLRGIPQIGVSVIYRF